MGRLWYAPTAVQRPDCMHETPLSKLLPDPTFGLGEITHDAPFQTSIRVCRLPKKPTATHAVFDVHDTPASSFTPLGWSGLGTVAQLLPFHASIRLDVTPPDSE